MASSQAFGDVVPALSRQLRPKLCRILAWYRIPPEDAEDLVQTTLLLAMTRWCEIRSPAAWILGTLRNRCIMYWRGRRRHTAGFVPIEPIEHQLSVEPPQVHQALLADVEELCRKLSPRHRRVLTLRCHHELSPQEVARATGLRKSSVGKIVRRVRTRLRRAAGRQPPVLRRSQAPSLLPHPPRRRSQGGPPPGAGAPWSTEVEAFLTRGIHVHTTQRIYAQQLARTAAALDGCPLGALTGEALVAYRAAVMVDGRAPGSQRDTLSILRSFLLWAGEHGGHALQPGEIRDALRLPCGYESDAGAGACAEQNSKG
jgi:RNA polymerase sigma-70 factor (ECF subfamily)